MHRILVAFRLDNILTRYIPSGDAPRSCMRKICSERSTGALAHRHSDQLVTTNQVHVILLQETST